MPKIVQFRFEGQQIIVGQAGSESTVSEKYCDFLCVLICAESDTILTRDALVRLDSWAGNQPLSAGKQVARFLTGLGRKGIFPVEQSQKTNGWRLGDAWRAAVTPALCAAAKTRLAGRVAALHHGTGAGLATLLEWYRCNFEALSAMTTGRAAHGYAVLRGNMKATADEQLFAISNLLATRIEQRLDQPRLPVLASINLSADVITRALEIRRLAAYALHANTKD